MKKTFTLAVALVAMAGAADAQTSMMNVNLADGSVVSYAIDDVVNVTFSESGDGQAQVEEEPGWDYCGTGTYGYTVYFSVYGSMDQAQGLPLYRNADDPTRWKIKQWGYDVDFCFTYDEGTGDVIVDENQDTGDTWYGPVCVYDAYAGVFYKGRSAYPSKYENGTFLFSVVYDDDYGPIVYTKTEDEYETFALD